jgi:hypothetical protein
MRCRLLSQPTGLLTLLCGLVLMSNLVSKSGCLRLRRAIVHAVVQLMPTWCLHDLTLKRLSNLEIEH